MVNINLPKVVMGIIVLALAALEIITFYIFDLENLGQGHVI